MSMAIIRWNTLKYLTIRSKILPITESQQDTDFALSLSTEEQTPHLH